ncbi:MAG: DUF3141 domain-containing protein [Hyphomicrobiaceae bacterium]
MKVDQVWQLPLVALGLSVSIFFVVTYLLCILSGLILPDWSIHQQWLHPMRIKTYLWSESFMPWMGAFAVLADAVARNRHAIPDDNPLMAQERKLIAAISDFWESARRLRDAAQERAFTTMYGE